MKKINFNDRYGLTDAVIEGRKTMTRRPVSESLWEIWTDYDDFCNSVIGGIARGGTSVSREYYHECDFFKDKCRYKVGEVVAVAQSYKTLLEQEGVHFEKLCVGIGANDIRWYNKMFVRADLMPHRICITGIKSERLQSISHDDAMREGIYMDGGDDSYMPHYFYDYPNNPSEGFDTPREAFAALVDKVYGRGTWDRNPWVVVYEFELVK